MKRISLVVLAIVSSIGSAGASLVRVGSPQGEVVAVPEGGATVLLLGIALVTLAALHRKLAR